MRVAVTAPATSANLGPGFDAFGICLERPFDTVVAKTTEGEGVTLEISGVGSESIPSDPRRNTAGRAALAVMRMSGFRGGVAICLKKGVRPGSGLGSSAASAAASAVAVARLAGGLPVEKIVEAAAEGESASAGEEHADNVAASIMGGFTIVRSVHPASVIRIWPPRFLRLVLALPDLYVSTFEARKILPRRVPLASMVGNVAKASTMVAAMMKGDLALLGSAMEDSVVEPLRAKLIKGYGDVKRAALASGASGVTVSGSGPAVLAVVDAKRASPSKVAAAMASAFGENGVGCETIISKVGRGAAIKAR
ncbi:MAG: homoserine kinase [Candidatus Brockarchaeota archaeon]|nr:homoserine kinase [Candidatus Brockarchaeota archaeon]